MSQFSPEVAIGSDYLERLLLARPPEPVGVANIADIVDRAGLVQGGQPGYAWERLPRWIAEIEDAFKKPSETPIIHVDLGSSLPLYVQMMRGLEYKRSNERAKDLLSEFLADDLTPDSKGGVAYDIHQEFKKGGKASNVRREALRTAVQSIIYGLTSYEMAGGDVGESTRRIKDRLLEELQAEKTVITDFDQTAGGYESIWQIRFATQVLPNSYIQQISAFTRRSEAAIAAGQRMGDRIFNKADIEAAKERIPISHEDALAYVDWQAETIAGMIAGNSRYRPARFISIDNTPPLEIAASSLINTPESTQQMNMFSHAVRGLLDPNLHIQADLFEPLPFPANSVNLITCFDAWPFYSSFEGLSEQELRVAVAVAITTINSWYEKLVSDGKIVIFPWATQDGGQLSKNVLSYTSTQLSLMFGHGVNERVFHKASLIEVMSEADKETQAKLSGAFSGKDDRLTALIIEKPNRKLVDRHAKALGKRSIIAVQSSD